MPVRSGIGGVVVITYLVTRDGLINETELPDDGTPPLTIRSHGIIYIYRHRQDNVAIYEEDESPTT